MKKIKKGAKRFFCIALTLVCLCPAVSVLAARRCDVDRDGVVSAEDARMVLRFAVQLDTPTESQSTVADQDGDRRITAADARIVLRMAVGLERDFESVLYETAHKYDGYTADDLPAVDYWVENVYRQIGKWCCYYTIHDVFRPALKAAGYSDARINLLAPNSFDGDKVRKALQNSTSISLPSVLFELSSSVYIPSLLGDYYLTHQNACTPYIFSEYYDDVVNQVVYLPTDNRWTYVPSIGDIVFASNKTSTYVEGYPTIDHTAQIIEVYDDGSFLCTDGCILFADGTEKPRVCEREYVYNFSRGAYEYKYNDVVLVLMIAKPKL